MTDLPRTPPRYSATFTPAVNAEIRRAAATGIYDIRGGGTKRHPSAIGSRLPLSANRCHQHTVASGRAAGAN